MAFEIIRGIDVADAFPAPDFNVAFHAPDACNAMAVRMPNHLGDAVMALPALAALKKLLPGNCALVVIAPAGHRALYDALPHCVDNVIPLPELHAAWARGTLEKLRVFKADAGVLFNHSFRDAWMMKKAKIPRLFGYAGRCRRFLLAGALPPVKRKRGVAFKIHQANLYYEIARAFGAGKWDGKMIDLFPAAAPALPEKARKISEHPHLLLVAPGAAYGAAKRYGADSYHKIAEEWIASGGAVAVAGSAAERPIGEEVLRGLPEDKTVDLCGETSLGQLMNLAKHCKVCVANDSGTMHLCCALKVPGATVFGPTDYTSTAPVGKWSMILSRTDCAPCMRRVCPLGENLCMRQISWRIVAEELHRLAGD